MNVFIKKLMHFAPLSGQEQAILSRACAVVRNVRPGPPLISTGDRPKDLYIILEGFACRVKIDEEGNRSIVSYLLPGDIGDQHAFILKEMDHDIVPLSPCRVAVLPQASFLKMVESHPRIIRALWWSTLVDEATAREWISNIASRLGPKRVAHLLCEFLMRLEVVGLVRDHTYSLPITQAQIGETLGLTSIHMSRVFKTLRERGLVQWNKDRTLRIPHIAKLKAFCAFDPNYLHLDASYQMSTARSP